MHSFDQQEVRGERSAEDEEARRLPMIVWKVWPYRADKVSSVRKNLMKQVLLKENQMLWPGRPASERDQLIDQTERYANLLEEKRAPYLIRMEYLNSEIDELFGQLMSRDDEYEDSSAEKILKIALTKAAELFAEEDRMYAAETLHALEINADVIHVESTVGYLLSFFAGITTDTIGLRGLVASASRAEEDNFPLVDVIIAEEVQKMNVGTLTVVAGIARHLLWCDGDKFQKHTVATKSRPRAAEAQSVPGGLSWWDHPRDVSADALVERRAVCSTLSISHRCGTPVPEFTCRVVPQLVEDDEPQFVAVPGKVTQLRLLYYRNADWDISSRSRHSPLLTSYIIDNIVQLIQKCDAHDDVLLMFYLNSAVGPFEARFEELRKAEGCARSTKGKVLAEHAKQVVIQTLDKSYGLDFSHTLVVFTPNSSAKDQVKGIQTDVLRFYEAISRGSKSVTLLLPAEAVDRHWSSLQERIQEDGGCPSGCWRRGQASEPCCILCGKTGGSSHTTHCHHQVLKHAKEKSSEDDDLQEHDAEYGRADAFWTALWDTGKQFNSVEKAEIYLPDIKKRQHPANWAWKFVEDLDTRCFNQSSTPARKSDDLETVLSKLTASDEYKKNV